MANPSSSHGVTRIKGSATPLRLSHRSCALLPGSPPRYII